MKKTDDETLYIFIDESGNLDFTLKGTKYWSLTSISTKKPLSERVNLHKLRYRVLEKGINLECFHATEDLQEVRDLAFQILCKLDDFEIDNVLVQKNKANPTLYLHKDAKTNGKIKKCEEKIYKLASQTLLQYIFIRYMRFKNIGKIIVILGSLFTNNKREFILKSLKQYLKPRFLKPFYIHFHKTEADINCQIADYCGWSIYVKNERDENRPYKMINDKIKSEFDIFKKGQKTYY